MKPIAVTILAVFIQLWSAEISLANGDAIFSKFYWFNDGRIASLEEVQSATFTEFEGAIAFGYSPHAVWIRLTIADQSDGGEVAIRVRPAFLRNIELYDPEMNGTTAPPMLSGRDTAINETNHVGLDNGFIIPSSPESRDVYLRITTTTSLTADVAVLPVAEARQSGFKAIGMVAVYFAFLLGFCLWSLVAWLLQRDALYGLFALRQLYSSAHIFVFFGSLRFFFSGSFGPEVKEIVYAFICCTVASVAGFFDVRLISEFGGSRWLRRAIYVLLCLPIVTLTLVATGQVQTALQIAGLGINFQLVSLVALAFTVKANKTKPFMKASILMLRFGFATMMVVVVVPLLMYQNLLQTSVPMFNILFLHAVISTIILFAILSIRSRQRDLMAQEAQLLVGVREAELCQESSRRMEKERFLSMLTHELRNPLSVIELLPATDPSSAATVRRAARDMADVIDRVEQSERIDSGQMHLEKTELDFSALVRQVAEIHSARDGLVVEGTCSQRIVSDAGLLHRVVENLLDNAFKYKMPGSATTIMLLDHAEGAVEGCLLRICNVIGMAGPPDPKHLFTKYYRAKDAHRQPGSGLGLFLVARWVRELGGTITYEQCDAPNGAQQAIFTVWVPR